MHNQIICGTIIREENIHDYGMLFEILSLALPVTGIMYFFL